jgi:hypothetical protein
MPTAKRIDTTTIAALTPTIVTGGRTVAALLGNLRHDTGGLIRAVLANGDAG